MKIIIPIYRDRVSSVFDTAKWFKLVSLNPVKEVATIDILLDEEDPIDKVKKIIALGVEVLICGAISRPLELMLVSSSVLIVPNTCGSADDVIAAFFTGRLSEKSFLMPGCTGQRRRHTHRFRNCKNDKTRKLKIGG